MSGGFSGNSVWLKAAFILISVGFVVWLSASGGILVTTNSSLSTAYTAFLIIGVCTYFISVMLIFLATFVDELSGNAGVLIAALVFAFIAGFSAIIVLAMAQTIGHSDRMAYAAVCAITSAVFCILKMRG